MLALQTACMLEDMNINCNIVSVPCFDLLCEQDKEYIDTIINPSHKVIAIEMATAMEYYKFADYVIDNSRDLAYTEQQVVKITEEITCC